MKLILLIIILSIVSCASNSRKTKSLTVSDEITYSYNIKYPDYTGTTKDQAKKMRKQYLDKAMENILVSIYRTGDFGNLDYLEIENISYPQIPLTLVKSRPTVFNYTETYDYGQVKGKIYKQHKTHSGLRTSRMGSALKPIAYDINKDMITIPLRLRVKLEENFILLKRNEMKSSLSKFYNNYSVVGSKSLFNRFLEKIEFYKIAEKAADTNPDIYHIFKSYRNISPTGMGSAREEVNEPNTLSFVLNKYKHSPYNSKSGVSLDYDPVKFLWGIIFVLNSELEIERVNKKLLKVTITIPLKKIMSNYTVKRVSDYIE